MRSHLVCKAATLDHRMTHSTHDFDRAVLRQLLVVLLMLFTAYLTFDLFDSDELRDALNWIGPIVLLVACLMTGYRLVSRNPLLMWTPIPWFLAACGAFFGFGPLLYTFANGDTIAQANTLWAVNDTDLFRTNLLNVVGITVTAASFLALYKHLRLNRISQVPRIADKRTITIVTIVFLAVGIIVKYRFALPHEFGIAGQVLSGSVYSLAQLTTLSLAMLGYLATRRGGVWILILAIVLLCEASVDLLRFSKAALILTLIMPLLGCFLAKPKIKVLVIGALGIVCIYVLSTPIVGWGRLEVAESTGVFYRATLQQRLDVIHKGLATESIGGESSGSATQGWWSRLSYANAQAFAMHQYDEGRPGATLGMALYTFIPRILWPDKPLITGAGVDFTELIHGHRGSSTGVGIFGEAYWNGGWWLIVGMCICVGILFAILTRLALFYMRRLEVIYLPCIFLGMKMGFRVDGWIVGDYIGVSVIYAGYFLVIYMLRISNSQGDVGAPANRRFQSPIPRAH